MASTGASVPCVVDLPPLHALKALVRKAVPRDAFSPPTAEAKDALTQALRLVEDDGCDRISTRFPKHRSSGHPVLWRALAKAALRAMNMDVAERALMACKDLQVCRDPGQ